MGRKARASQAEENTTWEHNPGKAPRFIHSAFPTMQTNLDRSMSYIFLKIKISRKGGHRFDPHSPAKNLAVTFQILVVKLPSSLLRSAFLLTQQPFFPYVTSLASRTLSVFVGLWQSRVLTDTSRTYVWKKKLLGTK